MDKPTLKWVFANREAILKFARKRGAKNVRVFGSVVRGDAGTGSDVDFLVYMEPGRGFMDLGGLKVELEELLDCSVDVTSETIIRDEIRDELVRSARAL